MPYINHNYNHSYQYHILCPPPAAFNWADINDDQKLSWDEAKALAGAGMISGCGGQLSCVHMCIDYPSLWDLFTLGSVDVGNEDFCTFFVGSLGICLHSHDALIT